MNSWEILKHTLNTAPTICYRSFQCIISFQQIVKAHIQIGQLYSITWEKKTINHVASIFNSLKSTKKESVYPHDAQLL